MHSQAVAQPITGVLVWGEGGSFWSRGGGGGKNKPVNPRALTEQAAQLEWHMASSFIQHAKVFSSFTSPSTPSCLPPILLMQNDS